MIDAALSAVGAVRIDAAVRRVVDSGVRTRDLGGTASTEGFTGAVVAELTRSPAPTMEGRP